MFSKQKTPSQTAPRPPPCETSASKSFSKTYIIEHAEEELVSAEQMEEVLEVQRNTLARVEGIQQRLGEVENTALEHTQRETSARMDLMSEIMTHQSKNSEELNLVRRNLMCTQETLQNQIEDVRKALHEASSARTAAELEKLTELIACQKDQNGNFSELADKLASMLEELQTRTETSTTHALLREALEALSQHAQTLGQQLELRHQEAELAKDLMRKNSEERIATSENATLIANPLAELNESIQIAANGLYEQQSEHTSALQNASERIADAISAPQFSEHITRIADTLTEQTAALAQSTRLREDVATIQATLQELLSHARDWESTRHALEILRNEHTSLQNELRSREERRQDSLETILSNLAKEEKNTQALLQQDKGQSELLTHITQRVQKLADDLKTSEGRASLKYSGKFLTLNLKTGTLEAKLDRAHLSLQSQIEEIQKQLAEFQTSLRSLEKLQEERSHPIVQELERATPENPIEANTQPPMPPEHVAVAIGEAQAPADAVPNIFSADISDFHESDLDSSDSDSEPPGPDPPAALHI